MLLKPLVHKAILVTLLALVVVNAALGSVTVAVAGGAISRVSVAAFNRDAFVGVLMCGLGVFVFGVAMFVGAKTTHMPLFLGATGGTALLALTLLLVGALSAPVTSTAAYIDSALFEEHWYQAPPSRRVEIERTFGCCGLTGPGDFYGARWNATCAPTTLARTACCVGMRLGLGQNVSTLEGSCGVAELRYACCSAATQWPCYRMPPCLDTVVAWFSEARASVRHVAVGVAIALLLSLVVQVTALLMLRAHFHANESGAAGFSILESETAL